MLRDYQLLEPLARGGMGAVYRACHLRLNRQVALKVLPARLLAHPAAVQRFQREMQAVGALRHPAIVQATDGGEADGVHFLVMELIAGADGATLVQTCGPLPVASACEIARQAAVGMAYVHEQGIIHRDLKPSNWMVTTQGDVKILDLGLARITGEQLAVDELTSVGQLMGTVDYMAPEQLENSHDVDERADVYSLGATLYKLLTGCSPHGQRRGEPILAKLRRVAVEPAISLLEVRPDVPTEIAEFVHSMLSQSKEGRPTSMSHVAEVLAQWCSGSDLEKLVADAMKRRTSVEREEWASAGPSESPIVSLAGEEAPDPVSRKPSCRKISWWWTAAAVLLLSAAAWGIIITLETSAGQLVIETAKPDVEVRVLRAGQPYRQLTLKQQANSLRLGAGEYEIELVSSADGLEIQNGQFVLKRGETWLAKIKHIAIETAVNSVALTNQPDLSIADVSPRYDGKTLAEWLKLLREERSPQQIVAACAALEKLATGEQTKESVAALLVAVRYHDRNSLYGPKLTLWSIVSRVLKSRHQAAVADTILAELGHTREANIAFILDYLKNSAAIIRGHVPTRLIEHVDRLTTDSESQIRMQALSAYLAIVGEEAVERKLVAALADNDEAVQMHAAGMLTQRKSKSPELVEMLRRTLRQGALERRAEAAWHLGTLGPVAQLAVPDLLKIVEGSDAALTQATAFWPSVKDNAIHALAEIGDKSVIPALTAELMRRARNENRHNRSDSSSVETVADAIEKLSGMRPELTSVFNRQYIVWSIEGRDLSAAAFAVGSATNLAEVNKAIAIVERLLPVSSIQERDKLREVISQLAGDQSKPENIAAFTKLAKLFASYYDPVKVVWTVVAGITRYGGNDTPSQSRDAAIVAYKACAVEIFRAYPDAQQAIAATLESFLAQVHSNDGPVAAMIMMELFDELSPSQQVTTADLVLSVDGYQQTSATRMAADKVGDWAKAAPDGDLRRTQLYRQLNEPDKLTNRQRRVYLLFGLIRADLANEELIDQEITGPMRRGTPTFLNQLDGILESLASQPRFIPAVVEILESSQLDAGPADNTVRATLLPLLATAPSPSRPGLRPLLERYLESKCAGEAEAARIVLQAWKDE